jgi:hypothetical protein
MGCWEKYVRESSKQSKGILVWQCEDYKCAGVKIQQPFIPPPPPLSGKPWYTWMFLKGDRISLIGDIIFRHILKHWILNIEWWR